MQPELKQLLTSHLNVMMGKPVIVGTCITVELILEKLAAGETKEQKAPLITGDKDLGELVS